MKTLFVAVFALVANFALAAEMPKDQKTWMMHQEMGMMHTEMMNCMKSGKSTEACHTWMMKNCKMGEEKCTKMMTMMDESTHKMMDMMSESDMTHMSKGMSVTTGKKMTTGTKTPSNTMTE